MAVLHVADADFEAVVLKESDKHVLVDFWAEWCGPCRMLGPIIEKIENTHSGKLKVVKLDTDSNPQTAQTYQITGIPCCILFKDGKEVGRLIGYKSESAFEAELKKYMPL